MRSAAFWEWFDGYAAPRLAEWRPTRRDGSFRRMFEHLDKFNRPVRIVETGCIEEPDNFAGNGCSTILFDKYIETHPASTAMSFEIDAEKVAQACKLCPNVTVMHIDSVAGLKIIAGPKIVVDLLYLDASAHDWSAETVSQVHHFNELMAIMPSLTDESMVAVDDSMSLLDDYPQRKILGKGGLVAEYALSVGAEIEFCEYQVGFTRMTGPPSDVSSMEQVVLRARKHVEDGNMLAADRLYRLVMYLTQPPFKSGKWRIARAEACANFGTNAHEMKRFGFAADWYFMALDADPQCVEHRCDLVRSMVAAGALKAARRQAEIATEIAPDNPLAWQTLGGVESDLMDTAATIRAYDRQVEAASKGDNANEYCDALLNRGVIALDSRDYDTVRKMCRTMLEVGSRKGDAWHLLAMIEYRLARHEKAIEYFDKAIALNCRNLPMAHWNRSLPLQCLGRYKESFAEHSVWGPHEVTQYALYVPHHRFLAPRWEGRDDQPAELDGRKAVIHVHQEAGYGDNISMWRYFPLMVERGFHVRYEVGDEMLSLARRNFPEVECVTMAGDYPGVVGLPPTIDYHIPVGDLPYAFGTDIDTVPWSGPYLKADPKLSQGFAELLAEVKGRKIGLCWSSGIRKTQSIWLERYGRMKSMRFSDCIPLLGAIGNDDSLISLMVGDGREEHGHKIFDLLSKEPNFEETAALIDNLDLVITVDTAVAHLAGAMGKPTWVMMQRDGASWHFMCWHPGASWNEASPWYPSARIFRQHEFDTPGYWKDVIDDVARALRECTGPDRSPR
jgi:hypothetical protein